ncbi:MAG: Gfo/Idh/MocA family oxidoreductase [Verrucomicrobia bacterium]|nr:Gfo/Idh/MocA family oxidoreductase [Verrucomicrobiota bacterium]
MNVAIIGAGLQCKRRAPVVAEWPGARLVAVASSHLADAEAMADTYSCEGSACWQDVVARNDVDVVLVCTPPHVHAEISLAAMTAGKHVLCEKPLTRTVAEAESLVDAARQAGVVLKCGFNHRHHPAIWEAHRLLTAGHIGAPVFARCRYGIIPREDYHNEWRADPTQAAGGQFIEQGSHAIDLFRWFLGELVEVGCMTATHYFKQQSLDDGGMAIFRAASGATASLHTALTQWKNLFSFEVFGEDGYVVVEGLGGGYGTETLRVGKRDFTAPFQDQVTEYRGGDKSWKAEWVEFMDAIAHQREPIGNGTDGLAAMRLALTAYEAERQQRILTVVG